MNSKNNQLATLLQLWYPKRDAQQWVLGTIFDIEGSSYRKPGAMMLFGSLGEQYGLLSGGCLESDLMRHARSVMDSQQSKIVVYDMTDEDDIGWQLGIGCGGVVNILLQPLNSNNHYLGLPTLIEHMQERKTAWYVQCIEKGSEQNTVYTDVESVINDHPYAESFIHQVSQQNNTYASKARLVEHNAMWLFTPIVPSPHIMIFGGGIDARSVVEIADTLGWQITLVDKRAAYARKAHFPQAHHIIKTPASELLEQPEVLSCVDAIVIMSHNIVMDGEALKVAQKSSASYVGLLGPIHRRERILANEGLTMATLTKPLSSPIGLDIGGQLPESIALSIISECHQTFYKSL